MSSPLCSLDKNKKSPSNPSKSFGKRSMPFRTREYAKERELLDDIVEQQITSRRQHFPTESPSSSTNSSIDFTQNGITPKKLLGSISSQLPQAFSPLGHINATKSSLKKAPPPSDIELMSTMMKRITQLEKQTSYYSREVLEKSKKIKILEEKLSLLSKAQELRQVQDPSRVEQLENKCHQLQQQVYEMETFLADYGMVWVGDQSDPFSESYVDNENESLPVVPVTNTTIQSRPSATYSSEFNVDYDLILKNIHDLNIIAGEGESHVEKTKDGARLKVKESIQLTLYANGIMMFNGPFRSYADVTTKRCLRDIMDGYFPTELQHQYPEGVPIQVTDKRSVVFKDPRLSRSFPGVGRMLQEDEVDENEIVPKPSTSLPHVTSNHDSSQVKGDDYVVESDLPGPRLSVEQFLQHLPKNVLHDGKVVGIRSSLKDLLAPGSTLPSSSNNATEIVETEAVQEMQQRMNLPAEARPISARNVTTIRVKCEDGAKTYILKMKFTDTIRDLRRYIDKQRPRFKKPYEIMSTFPKQVHSFDNKTLEDSGLIPNATLHLKPKK